LLDNGNRTLIEPIFVVIKMQVHICKHL